jgi:hypothetical protein
LNNGDPNGDPMVYRKQYYKHKRADHINETRFNYYLKRGGTKANEKLWEDLKNKESNDMGVEIEESSRPVIFEENGTKNIDSDSNKL